MGGRATGRRSDGQQGLREAKGPEGKGRQEGSGEEGGVQVWLRVQGERVGKVLQSYWLGVLPNCGSQRADLIVATYLWFCLAAASGLSLSRRGLMWG
jgi:hypothetical protein